MKNVFIYVLSHPTTGRIRYVGKTCHLAKRLQEHAHPRKRGNSHRACWIRSLNGVAPFLTIVDTVLEEDWRSAEAAYIQFFREEGCDLVNHTEGGEGGIGGAHFLGKKHSEKSKAKTSGSLQGRIRSDETRIRMSAAQMGNKKFLGHTHPPEWRVKLSAANRGEKNPNFGKSPTEETRAKVSAALILHWERKKADNLSKGAIISTIHCARL